MNKSQIQKLIEPFENSEVECDGMSKIISYLLYSNGIRYKHVFGQLIDLKKNTEIYHEWIVWNNHIIDYRARMWFGPTAPNGIFKENTVTKFSYMPDGYVSGKPSEFIFRLLTNSI